MDKILFYKTFFTLRLGGVTYLFPAIKSWSRSVQNYFIILIKTIIILSCAIIDNYYIIVPKIITAIVKKFVFKTVLNIVYEIVQEIVHESVHESDHSIVLETVQER